MKERKCSNPVCPLTQAISVVGGKWKPLIIYQLYNSNKRFGQLHAAVVGISRKVLTDQLNELLRDGLIDRQEFAETPPRVEYSLTERGRALQPIFKSMADWGQFLVKDYKSRLKRKAS
ncbi:MAG: winged helix-turn-helix transcriptional regulator [Luteibaculum sp.]